MFVILLLVEVDEICLFYWLNNEYYWWISCTFFVSNDWQSVKTYSLPLSRCDRFRVLLAKVAFKSWAVWCSHDNNFPARALIWFVYCVALCRPHPNYTRARASLSTPSSKISPAGWLLFDCYVMPSTYSALRRGTAQEQDECPAIETHTRCNHPTPPMKSASPTPPY